jgi:hypothetical protein
VQIRTIAWLGIGYAELPILDTLVSGIALYYRRVAGKECPNRFGKHALEAFPKGAVQERRVDGSSLVYPLIKRLEPRFIAQARAREEAQISTLDADKGIAQGINGFD